MVQGKRAAGIVSGHVFRGIMTDAKGPEQAAPRVRGLYPDQQNDVTADPDKYHENLPHGLAPFLSGYDFSTS
jgi:hypothetical protein